MVALGFILYGLFYACTDGIIKSLLVQYAGKENKASAIGYYSGLNGIILFFANILTGWAWYQFGSSIVFITIIAITLVSVVLLLVTPLQQNEST